jgi:hypothetical protein
VKDDQDLKTQPDHCRYSLSDWLPVELCRATKVNRHVFDGHLPLHYTLQERRRSGSGGLDKRLSDDEEEDSELA